MAPTVNKIRVRLLFEMPPPLPLSPHSKCYMFLINRSEMSCVADVEHAIAVKFGYSNTKSLALSIGKFVLLSNEDIDVIRENDEITVSVEDSVAFIDLISLPGTNSNCQIGSDIPSVVSTNDLTTTKKRSRHEKHSLRKAKKKRKSGVTSIDSKKKKVKLTKIKRKTKRLSINPDSNNGVVNGPVETDTSKMMVSSHATVSEEHCPTETNNKEDIPGTPFCVTSTVQNTDNCQLPSVVKYAPTIPDVEPVIVKEELVEHGNMFSEKSGVRTRSSKKSEIPPVAEQCPVSPTGPMCDCYDDLRILSWPPRVGDVIAYKELEMTDNYTPAMSSFREAKVLEISGSKPQNNEKCLHVNILWPKKITSANVKGKFDLDVESDPPVESKCNSKKRLLSWATLIDPRLIK
uniref:Coilin-like n=1 Tax=Phallusia mammillata TaxID=59560 RepID=A0A6F9D955_9ASCI|nr:coilin-like [Phallusia mammillata]